MRMLRILLTVSLCANAVPPQDDTKFDVQLLQTALSVETKPDIAATQIEHTKRIHHGWQEDYGSGVSTNNAATKRRDAEAEATEELEASASLLMTAQNEKHLEKKVEHTTMTETQEAAIDVLDANDISFRQASLDFSSQHGGVAGKATVELSGQELRGHTSDVSRLGDHTTDVAQLSNNSTAGRCGLKIYTNLSDDANYNDAYEKIRSACLEVPYSEALCDEVVGELFKSKKGQMTSVFNVAQFDAFCNATRDIIKADIDHQVDMDTLESSHSDGASSLLANRASSSAPLHARGRTVDESARMKQCV